MTILVTTVIVANNKQPYPLLGRGRKDHRKMSPAQKCGIYLIGTSFCSQKAPDRSHVVRKRRKTHIPASAIVFRSPSGGYVSCLFVCLFLCFFVCLFLPFFRSFFVALFVCLFVCVCLFVLSLFVTLFCFGFGFVCLFVCRLVWPVCALTSINQQ